MVVGTINDAVTMAGGEGALLAGRYRIVKPLGQGGMGSVWLAEDSQLDNKLFAIKMLPSILVSNKRAYRQLKEEALVAMRLVHPNIVTLRAFEEDNGNPFLVMDYVDGQTLDDYIAEHTPPPLRGTSPVSGEESSSPSKIEGGGGAAARGSMTGCLQEEEVIRILKPIADALDYAHKKGVVHRDVKPGNVMIASDGTPYILDFGIAREIQETMTRVTGKLSSGTLLYMSPEQLRGLPPKPAQDIYSFAATVYECIKGEPPFCRGQVEHQILNEKPEPLPGGVRFCASVMAGLAKDPEVRPAACAAVLDGDVSLRGAEEWRSGVTDAPTPEDRKGDVSRRGAEAQRSGIAGKALGALALLAALGAGGYYGWTRHEDNVRAQEAEEVRFRQQVYELKGKASQAHEKNEKEDWHSWPHFSRKAKELEGAYRAGESAFEKNDYEVARLQYMAVRDNWYWLSSNKVVRTEAEDGRQRADESRNRAESARARELAGEAFSAAYKSFVRAGQAFAAGNFVVAAAEFDKADKGFESASAVAKEESGRLAAEKKKSDTEAALAAFRATPARYDDGFRLAQTADQDNPDIQFYIGVCHDFGYGVAKDEAEAVKWYRKAAEQGQEEAQFNLGVSYDNGQGVAKDNAEAVKWYRKAAEQGNAKAQFNLGVSYDNGQGVAKDDAEAVKWYRKAAEQGHARAQFNLGLFYANGRGVAKDDSESVKWYRKAAEQGNAASQCNLGFMYANGRGIAKDDSEAVKWYRRAAEQGDADSQSNLGFMYEKGRGVTKDETEAVKWYRKAAEQGHARAQFSLGLFYANGRGIAKDDLEAVKWYLKSAEQGYASAQCNLGYMYENGRGVAKDDSEAVKWYRRAAEQGDADSQSNLGFMYEKGRGVTKDETEAVKWYRKAAEQGHARAQFNLGLFYANGRGIAKDDSEAVKWYRRAADQGDADSQCNLGYMYENGRGVAKDETEAVKWYRKAADQGDAGSQCNLAFMYENGRGVAKNVSEALKWYRKAAEQGNERAKNALKRLSACGLGDFFPLAGVTLGKTRHSQIVAMGGKAEGKYSDHCVDYLDMFWWDHNKDGIVESLYATHSDKMPSEWAAKGLSWELSYDGWMAFFRNNGFSIKILQQPKVVPYYSDSSRKTLQAKFEARASDGSIEFRLDFDFGNANGEGCSTASRNSLYSISVDALKP